MRRRGEQPQRLPGARLATCAGTLTLRIPKLRTGSFFPDDVIERHRRADRALVAAVAEMYATGTSARKVRRVAEKMGVSRLSEDQVSAIASSLDADIEELCARPLDGSPAPYVWLDAVSVNLFFASFANQTRRSRKGGFTACANAFSPIPVTP